MLQHTPKKQELAELRATSRPVLYVIKIAIGRQKVGSIYDGVKKFPIIARLSDDQRKDVMTIRNLPVGISEGFTIPINKVADINFVETFSAITRENSQRRVAILINPETRDIESFVKKAQKAVEQKINLPEGYFIEWGGTFKNLQSAKQKLSLLVIVGLLLILTLPVHQWHLLVEF
jgi:cobalt-zinc-cadmium resistance protein CzcA